MFAEVPLPSWPVTATKAAASAVVAQLSVWVRSEPLLALARDWGGVPPTNASANALFKWYDAFSAAHWDFRRGAERNQASTADLSQARAHLVKEVAHALGMVEPRAPKMAAYDFCLVLGGLIRACLVRPRYAAELKTKGVAIGAVVALGGFRPLAGDELAIAQDLAVHASNEFDAMSEGVRRAFSLSSPVSVDGPPTTGNADWRVASYLSSDPISVIAAPSSEPETRRANSVDTFQWWAMRNAPLAARRILLITNPIYVPYQGAGAIEVLGLEHGAAVETVGVSHRSAHLGKHTQRFTPANYLQEIRSAIRGYDLLFGRLSALG